MLNLSKPIRIHIIGIGGAGMSAIAVVLNSMGHQVSGSDLKDSPAIDRLRSLGVEVFVGHNQNQIGNVDVVAISSAIPQDNVEILAARSKSIPILKRSEVLAAISASKNTIAVAGTHGKTTTSSMLSLILTYANLKPSFIIGGETNEINSGAAWDEGEWLVIEADESDGTFLELKAKLSIVTNIEPDHLEFHGSFEALVKSFEKFMNLANTVVCFGDDPVIREIKSNSNLITFGLSEEVDYKIVALERNRSSCKFELYFKQNSLGQVTIPIPGLHNVLNATAALVMSLQLGIYFSTAAKALSRFTGVARRFELRGQRNGIVFIDDYGHLPGEIKATLSAVSDGQWERVVAVFQPHRYSRTASLWKEFGTCFDQADLIVITDIYSSGEPPRPGVSGKLIAQAVIDHSKHSSRQVSYVPTRPELLSYLRASLSPGDVCITLGAGDITSLADELLADPTW